jgi:hypothetical protein
VSTRASYSPPLLNATIADLGATAIGAVLIFAGFDQKASKIAFIPVVLYIIEIAWWARKDKFVLTHLTANIGVLVLFRE